MQKYFTSRGVNVYPRVSTQPVYFVWSSLTWRFRHGRSGEEDCEDQIPRFGRIHERALLLDVFHLLVIDFILKLVFQRTLARYLLFRVVVQLNFRLKCHVTSAAVEVWLSVRSVQVLPSHGVRY